jgi:hypothetical protein
MKKLPEDSPVFIGSLESRRELITMLARARAKRELAEEKRLKEQQAFNRPPAPPSEDAFTEAAERFYAREAYIQKVLDEVDAADLALERELARRRRFRRSLQRAKKILAKTAYLAKGRR